MDPSGIVAAIQDRAWYSVIAWVVVLLIAVWKRVSPQIWDRIPPRIQWLPAVLLAGASSFVASWQTGAAWPEALSVAIFVAVTGGSAAVGIHHSAKRVAGSGDGGKPVAKVGPVSLVLLKMGLILMVVAGCSQNPEPCSPDGIVAAKRTVGAGVIVAGRCDKDPLGNCPALQQAQNAHAAHVLACQAAGKR